MEYDLNVREYWRILRKRKVIVLFSTLMMAIFSFGIAYIKKPVPAYETTATLKIEKSTTATGIYLEALSWSGADYLETQVSIVASYPIMEKVAKEMRLIDKNLDANAIRSNSRLINTVLELKDRVSATREGDTNLVNITSRAADPRMAQEIANTVARVYTIEHTNEVNKRTTESRKFIEEQIERVGEKLEQAEERVKRFRERHKLVSLDSQTSILLGRLTTAEAEYAKLAKLVEVMSDVFNRLEPGKNKPISTKETFYVDEASALYKNLSAKLVSLLLEKDALLLTYTEEHPKVKKIDSQSSEIARNMTNELGGKLSSIRKRVKDIKATIEDYQQRLELLPDKRLTLARLERDVKLNEKVYSLLESKLQEAKIMEAGRIEEIVIVRPALEPQTPINSSQVIPKTAMGAVIGFIIGLIFAFVYETLDTSIGAIKEVEEFLGVTVLGVIPAIDMKEVKGALEGIYKREEFSNSFLKAKARLITHFIPKSTAAECYRAMRTNLQFTGFDRQLRTIAFTSAVSDEGKSTTVVNTSIAMAQAQNRVLLVEADFRKPVISRWLGIEPLPGLTEVILGSYGWRDTIRTIADIMLGEMDVEEVMLTPGLDNLHIIPCGQVPPNPAEVINSDNLIRFFEETRQEYDVILVDLPPVLSVADTSIVSARVDAVMMVYRAGSTARQALRRAKGQLEQVRANVIGVVLNELKAEISSDYTEIDYHRYYGYDTGEGSPMRGRLSIPLPGFLKKLYQVKNSWKKISLAKFIKELYQGGKSRKTRRKGAGRMTLWRKVAIVFFAFMMLGIGVRWREASRREPLWQSHSGMRRKIIDEQRKGPVQSQMRPRTNNEEVRPR